MRERCGFGSAGSAWCARSAIRRTARRLHPARGARPGWEEARARATQANSAARQVRRRVGAGCQHPAFPQPTGPALSARHPRSLMSRGPLPPASSGIARVRGHLWTGPPFSSGEPPKPSSFAPDSVHRGPLRLQGLRPCHLVLQKPNRIPSGPAPKPRVSPAGGLQPFLGGGLQSHLSPPSFLPGISCLQLSDLRFTEPCSFY